MDLGDLIVKFKADITNFQSGMNTVSTKMDAAQKNLTKTGAKLTASITAPIVGIGTASFKMATDFETSMSKVTGLVGVAQDQVSEWGDEILRIAPQLGKAPQELADALFFVTSAGIKGAEAIDVLTQSAKASVAGLGETEVIADLVTSALNAYGTENINAAQATDILVASVREGKASADSLAGAMGSVLPISAEMGVSFDQVGAAIAAMTRTGTDANEAATQLKSIMTGLLKPSQQAEEALQAMGMSSADLRRQIKEDGLIATLADLRQTTNQYGEDALAKVYPNIRGLSGVLDLMGSNAADNIAIFDSLENATGALDSAFGAASNTTQFKLDQAMGSMKSTLVSIGQTIQEAAVPLIEQLSAALKEAGDWFRSLDDGTKQMILKFAGIAAAVGPVLLIFGQVAGAISTIATVMAALTGPIGLVIAGIAALAAGVLYLWDNWEAVTERMSDVNWWKNALIQMLQWFYEYNPTSLLIKGLNAVLEYIGKNPIPNPFENLADGLEEFKVETKEYKNEFGSFKDAVKNGVSELTGLMGGLSPGQLFDPITPTEEQNTRQTENIALMQRANEQVVLNTETLMVADGVNEELMAKAQSRMELAATANEALNQAVTQAVASVGIGIAEMAGQLLAGAENMNSFADFAKGVGQLVLGTLADLAKQMGEMAIKMGATLLGIKFGLKSLNPVVMVAAGAALVALSSFFTSRTSEMSSNIGSSSSGRLQGLATGGMVTKSGQFMVGENGPERVTLPAGAAVTPNEMLGGVTGMMDGELVARVTGSDLEFVMTRWNEDKNRIS